MKTRPEVEQAFMAQLYELAAKGELRIVVGPSEEEAADEALFWEAVADREVEDASWDAIDEAHAEAVTAVS